MMNNEELSGRVNRFYLDKLNYFAKDSLPKQNAFDNMKFSNFKIK